MTPELRKSEEPYTRTFTSFSGADMIPILDGSVIGELSSITWEKNVESYMHGGGNSFGSDKVRGTMTATIFTKNPLQQFEGKKFDMLCYYTNEFGQSMLEFVKGVHLVKTMGGMSVDTIASEIHYEYAAEDFVTVSEPDFKEHQEQLRFVLENDGKRDHQLEVDAYKALMRWNLQRGAFIVLDPEDLTKLAKEREERKKKNEEYFAQQKAELRAKAEAEKAEASVDKQMEKLSELIAQQLCKGKAF